MAHDRFTKGKGKYRCQNCGKQTRDTGQGAELDLCFDCYEQEQWDNFVADGGDPAEVPADYQRAEWFE